MNSPRIVALVGPTAAGKSRVALEVAEVAGAEIVAVDAFTVYRGMDIGTAKPAASDRARVPHHCLDLLDPSEACTVEWFQSEARGAISEVFSRGRSAVLVGGSGLYFRSIVDAFAFPPTDPEVRDAIEERFAGDAAAAHQALALADPDAAARMEPTNLRRAIRALEVIALTGEPFSAWRNAWDEHASIYPDLKVVGVEVPRADLVGMIDRRVDVMFRDGLVDECRTLSWQELSDTARQAIAYAEVFDALDGRITMEEAIDRTKVRTRRFASRQVRWFAADPRVQWVAARNAAEVLRSLLS